MLVGVTCIEEMTGTCETQCVHDNRIAEHINDWTLEWKKEGEKLGLEIGKEIGAKVGAEEARRLVSRLIRVKYGDLPAWAVLKLDQADTAQLEYWAEHILTAESIEALLE